MKKINNNLTNLKNLYLINLTLIKQPNQAKNYYPHLIVVQELK